jgi:hypothetical protein
MNQRDLSLVEMLQAIFGPARVFTVDGEGGLQELSQEKPRVRIHYPLWMHVKSGRHYISMSSSHREADMEEIIQYVSTVDGAVFNRPHSEFFDGRFEPLNEVARAQYMNNYRPSPEPIDG